MSSNIGSETSIRESELGMAKYSTGTQYLKNKFLLYTLHHI